MQESRALLSMDLRLPIIIPTSIITRPLTYVTSAAHHHHHQDQCPGILRRCELVSVGRRNFGLLVVGAAPPSTGLPRWFNQILWVFLSFKFVICVII